MLSFGERLKEERIKKGLTQQEVAEKAGVTAQIIVRYEKNKTSPNLEVAGKLAEIFGKTIDYLATGKEEIKEELSEDETETLIAYRVLPADRRKYYKYKIVVESLDK